MKKEKSEGVLLDKKQALKKAEHFCAYQERSQKEVRSKLLDWGIRGDELEEIISELILNNYLNEQRFAMHYASGKFNIKKWGRIKIKQGLKLKGISEKLIQKAIFSFDEADYSETLKNLAEKKAESISEKDKMKRNFKLIYYLQSRGFERDLIFTAIKDL